MKLKPPMLNHHCPFSSFRFSVVSILSCILVLQVGRAYCASSDVVVSSPSIWSLVGDQGEVREIWPGPKDEKGARTGEPEDVLKTVAYGEIFSNGRWVDLRDLAYVNRGSRPGLLTLASRDGKVRILFTTRRSFPQSPIFIRYRFTAPTDFRFRMELKETPQVARIEVPEELGVSSLRIHDSTQLNLATDPSGSEVSSGQDGMTREVKRAMDVLVCLYLGQNPIAQKSKKNAAQIWVEQAGGTEDDTIESQNRLAVHTGVEDFDRLLEYSVDAVESARFRSGVLIAGRDGWYKNTWIRDGTYSTIGTDLFGLHAEGDAFYRYWIRNGGYSWGGEREAQQPAIAILGIWFHSRVIEDDTIFLNSAYAYVSRFANYYAQRVEKEGMLDTAEEWICQVPTKTAWPNAEIYAGLRAAAKIARRLGHESDSAKWDAAAQSLQTAILETAYDKTRERFIPLAGPAGAYFKDQEDPTDGETSGPMQDERVDSGMLMLSRLEVLGSGLGAVAVDDPRFAGTQAWIHRILEQKDHSISRFEGNPASPHYTQGEWPVWPLMSSVAADVELLRGRKDRAWRYLLSGLVRKRGYDAEAVLYALPEQWTLDGKAVNTTAQLTWSHGEFLASSVFLLTGLQVDVPNADLALAPSLPPGSNSATIANFFFRGWRLTLRVKRQNKNLEVKVTGNYRGSRSATVLKHALIIAVPGRVLELHDNQEVSFAVPEGEGQSGRTDHASERAQLFSQILLGKDIPADLKQASSQELERRIRAIEDEFDRTRTDNQMSSFDAEPGAQP